VRAIAKYNHNHDSNGEFASDSGGGGAPHELDNPHHPRVGDGVAFRDSPKSRVAAGKIESVDPDGRSGVVNFSGAPAGKYRGRQKVDLTGAFYTRTDPKNSLVGGTSGHYEQDGPHPGNVREPWDSPGFNKLPKKEQQRQLDEYRAARSRKGIVRMDMVMKSALAQVCGTDSGDDDFPGTFDVILATPHLDRDGDELHPDGWKTPLPEHITFDSDHGMTVASTVGSGAPVLDGDGNVRVKGTYASTAHAQDVRKLVNEKHIRHVSVTFMEPKAKGADGKTIVGKRELLNGAFVSVPANTKAVVLSSKSFYVDQLRRKDAPHANPDDYYRGELIEPDRNGKYPNVRSDIPEDAMGDSNAKSQLIHDLAASLGARCAGSDAYAGLTDGAPSYSKALDRAAAIVKNADAPHARADAGGQIGRYEGALLTPDRNTDGRIDGNRVPDASGDTDANYVSLQEIHDQAVKLGAACSDDYVSHGVPEDACGASDANDSLHGVQAVLRVGPQSGGFVDANSGKLQTGKSADPDKVQLLNGQGANLGLGTDPGDHYPRLQAIHDAAVQLGGVCSPAATTPPWAEDGEVWGANSPVIDAPISPGKKALVWAQQAVADESEAKALALEILSEL